MGCQSSAFSSIQYYVWCHVSQDEEARWRHGFAAVRSETRERRKIRRIFHVKFNATNRFVFSLQARTVGARLGLELAIGRSRRHNIEKKCHELKVGLSKCLVIDRRVQLRQVLK